MDRKNRQKKKPFRGLLWRLLFIIICVFFLQSCLGPSSLRHKAARKPEKTSVTMKVTGYCPCGKCCNWKRKWFLWPVVAGGPDKGRTKKIGICADGTEARKGTIAADTALYPFGTIMYVPGYGWGEVHDVGSEIKGQHIDLFFNTHAQAKEWGVQRLKVTVYK